MFVPSRIVILSVLSLVLVPAVSSAAELFVDPKHAQAGDKNPGTEAKPFKTIQPAVDAAKPGDTIYVKAGTYSDKVRFFKKSGTLDQPITMTAWKEDRVHIGCLPRPLPLASQWNPIPGTKCYSTVLPEPVPDDMLVLADDKPVVTQLKDTPPKDDQVAWATYRKSDRTLMYNANGKNPAQGVSLSYSRNFYPFLVELSDCWVIRKLEFGWEGGAVSLGGNNWIFEDCFFHHMARQAIFVLGRTNIIRRCNFYRCGYALAGRCIAPVIEDNLMVDCGQLPEEDVDSRALGEPEGGGATVFKGPSLCMIFRYNTVVEGHAGAGWYSDIGAKSCRITGNAFWDIPGGNYGAIYNELAVDDTLVMGNYFHKCGVTSSWCVRLTILDNYFDESGVEWANRNLWPVRNSFMTLRGNAFVNPPGHYLRHYGQGTVHPEGFYNCLVDFNQVRIKDGSVLIRDEGGEKLVKTIEDIRKIYGFEIHGEVKPYDAKSNDLTPEAMGGSTVTYRVPWGKGSRLARPMLSDAGVECRWPAAPEMASTGQVTPAFFWRIADGNAQTSALFPGWMVCDPNSYVAGYLPSSMAGYGVGENSGCRWYVDAEKKAPLKGSPEWKFEDPGQRAMLSDGNHFLVMCGLTSEKIPPQGIGYWTPLLASAPGAKITVSMRIRGKDIVSSDKGSPAVWLEFTNETGQKRQRAFVVGKDDAGRMHHEELTKGCYEWKDVAETVTAPDSAVRMALFFGVLPCKGELNFDDINIKTASEAGSGVAQEILPPRLPLPRIREIFPLDLSRFANRALADDEADDGKGGWTDQGSNSDMRELATGKRSFGGVPFVILPAPGGVVVLKSSNRNAGDLPGKVSIPVGRKFDTIFFLHTAAWFSGEKMGFKYVLHYADGKDVVVPVTWLNMVDWVAAPVAKFPNEEGTFTTVGETVKVPQFHQGSVYRMEWSAPLDRRQVELKSIDFVGDGQCVPILLGITGVTEW